MEAFKQAHLRPPEFFEQQGGITAIIPREIFMAIRGDQKTMESDQKTMEGDQKTMEGDQKTMESDQKNRIVEILRNRPSITRSELAKEINIHESSVKRRLKALVNEKRIIRVGPDKGGSWNVIELP